MILGLALLVSEMSLARQQLPLAATEQTSKLAERYWDCTLAKTRSYEASKEDPDAIVRAAVTACEDELMDFISAYQVDTDAVRMKPEDATELLNAFDNRLAAEAGKLVIEIRAGAANNAAN